MAVETKDFANRVKEYIRAGYQALAVSTSELGRCESELLRLAELGACQAVLTWDCIVGFVIQSVASDAPTALQERNGSQLTVSRPSPTPAVPGTRPPPPIQDPITSPLAALQYLQDMSFDQVVVILRNFHAFLKDPAVASLWQGIVNDGRFNFAENRKVVCHLPIILGTAIEFLPAIKPTVTQLEFELPGLADMQTLFVMMQRAATDDREKEGKQAEPASPELELRICRGLLGLTLVEAKNTLSLCGVRYGSLGRDDVMTTVEEEKAAILRKTSALTYISRDAIAGEDSVGGFAEYRKWLGLRRLCYSREAAELGLDRPKGVILMGAPGTGKSLVAKVSARMLGLPLVIVNMGGMMGSLVGESEAKTDALLQTLDAMQGCVALFDEAEKGLAGSSGTVTDSGVSQRIFGKILSWLQEKRSDTFVIMTMNTMKNIPPELFRKGRFDEVFWVDLPDEDERREILKIHLTRRGLNQFTADMCEADWQLLVKATDKFVGAELEQVVVESRLVAFADRGSGTPTVTEMLGVAAKTVTSATLDPESMAAIKEFCNGRARPVHAALPPVKTTRRPRVSTGN